MVADKVRHAVVDFAIETVARTLQFSLIDLLLAPAIAWLLDSLHWSIDPNWSWLSLKISGWHFFLPLLIGQMIVYLTMRVIKIFILAWKK